MILHFVLNGVQWYKIKIIDFHDLWFSADRPAAPVNVSVTHLRANSATVSWNVPEGEPVIGYAISQQVLQYY